LESLEIDGVQQKCPSDNLVGESFALSVQLGLSRRECFLRNGLTPSVSLDVEKADPFTTVLITERIEGNTHSRGDIALDKDATDAWEVL
jgi:hypothetical protein